MKRTAFLTLFFLTTFCAGSNGGNTQSSSVPGHGAIGIQIAPNPIVAHKVSGDTYDFPFDAIIRETGGQSVTITRVSAEVHALGGIPVASETYDAAEIAKMGFPTSVNANGELRYHFAPRKSVPDDRLFSSVSAELRVDGVDAGGSSTSATTTVTVTR